jgi:hypothetical protein
LAVASSPRASLGEALSKAKGVVGTGLSALALSAVLSLGPGVGGSGASEFSVLSDGPPTEAFVVDDANVLNRVTKSDLKRLLRDLEDRKGYHINVITLRKITTKPDSFEFADAVLTLLAIFVILTVFTLPIVFSIMHFNSMCAMKGTILETSRAP